MSNKTLIEWNADVGTRFLTIHPDGSFDIDKDAPPLFVIGELAKAFIRQQDRIKRLEEENNELRAEEARLLNTNGELERRIKRLEEVGSEAIYPIEYATRVRIWTKAKEDKL